MGYDKYTSLCGGASVPPQSETEGETTPPSRLRRATSPDKGRLRGMRFWRVRDPTL